jgi:anti-sigma regulatory factor (Ser/Thr protein kinase)
VITRLQIRAVLSAGGQVVDAGGRPVGHILDVALGPDDLEPAWLTVAGPGGHVVVPLAGAHQLGGCVQLPWTAADVHRAPTVDGAIGPLTSSQAEGLGGYFASLTVPDDRPGGRSDGAPRTGAPPPGGDGRATVGRPDPVRVLAGTGLPGGRDRPVAYPGAAPGPWPPLTASSAGPPWWHRQQWRWPSTRESVATMRRGVSALLDISGLPVDDQDDLVAAASEATANAVEHAGSGERPYVDVLAEVGADWAEILVQDHGRWRAATGGTDRGQGLYLMSRLADTTVSVGRRGTTVLLRSHPAARG